MNTRILNRAGKLPDDGFYQIEALGEHINHAARVVQVIDAKAVESIVNRFAAEAAATGEEFPGLRIDKDHLSQSMANSTESLGWAMQLRNREGVPEARIDWTALGRPLIEAKDGQPPVFKFFSTEYDPNKPGNVEKIGTRIVNRKSYDVIRPLRLDGLSLTNDPNNKGQRPISNRNGNHADAGNHENEPNMKEANKVLGLAEDAPETSTVAEIQKIQNRATTAEASVTTLTKERDELLSIQVEADLETYKSVITNRDNWTQRLLTDRKGALAILADIMPAGADGKKTPITNRSAAKSPAGGESGAEAAADEQRAARISNRARAIRTANPRITLSDAYATAAAEVDAETK